MMPMHRSVKTTGHEIQNGLDLCGRHIKPFGYLFNAGSRLKIFKDGGHG